MTHLRNVAVSLAGALLLLGCFDTASAQSNTLQVSSSQINLTTQVGANPQPVFLTVTSSTQSVTFTFATSTTASPNWLVVTSSGGSSLPTPAVLSVTANASSLAAGTYNGTISLTANGVSNSPVTVSVTLTVGTSTQLTAAPTSLSFNGQVGGAAPPAQSLVISSSGAAVNFTATAATSTGGNWLQFSPTSGTTGASSGTLQVQVNPSGLMASTTPYSGTITITPTNTGAAPLIVPVSLTIGSTPTLTLGSYNNFQFAYQLGTSLQQTPPQTFFVGSSSSPLNVAIGFTPDSGGNWLVLNPSGNVVTPAASDGTLTVTAAVASNIGSLAPGTYTGTITLSSPGAGNPTQTIKASLVVSAIPVLALNGSLSIFGYQTNGANPPNQTAQLVTTSGQSVPFSVSIQYAQSGVSWLTVGPVTGQTTPATLTFSATPSGLAVGQYLAIVNVTSPNAGNTLQFYVFLIVSGGNLLSASPSSLTYNFQTSTQQTPVAQTVTVTSAGAPLQYSLATATGNCGSSWLSVNPTTGTTPGSFQVSVNPAGIAPASSPCTGTITITSAGSNNSATVAVTLNVSSTPLLNISPTTLSFTTQAGTAVTAPQNVNVTSTDNATVLQFSAVANTSWILLPGSQNLSTPFSLPVRIDPTGLTPGNYTGTISISSTALPAPQTVTVSLTVTTNTSVTITPGSLTFNQAQGGPAPATQTLGIVSSAGSLPFTAAATSTPGGWLTVSPAQGTATATATTLTVTANGSTLSQGTYTGQITFTVPGAANPPAPVQVTLIVGAGQTLTASPTSLSFSYQMGAASNPVAQTVTLTSTGGPAAYTTSVSTTGGGSWLTATAAGASTGGTNNTSTVSVSVNPAGLTASAYNGTVTISSPVLATPIQIGVTFTVTAQPSPAPTTIFNAASSAPGPISPGELITIYGALMGPAKGVQFSLSAQGTVATTLAGTQVTFDGIPGPILYSSAGQVNAIVPYAIAGRLETNIVVVYNGVSSSAVQQQVAAAAPGVFTVNSQGTGQGSILNQNSTPNGPTNAAAKGSVVQIFATGGGLTNPLGTIGNVAPTGSLEHLSSNVTVIIGGQPAQLEFAGAAPGLVEGVTQVNAVIPSNAPTGNAVPVVITVNGAPTSASVTLAIQ